MASTLHHIQPLNHQPFKLLQDNQKENACLVSVDLDQYHHFKESLDDWLHAEEMCYAATLSAERRQASFLLGRVAAKAAIRTMVPHVLFPDINIRMGVFKDPVPQFPHDASLRVGITHSSTLAAALCFPATHPMAIDLEDLNPKRARVMQKQCLPDEWKPLEESGMDLTLLFTILWTAKEAVSKALKTGLTSPVNLLATQKLQSHPDGGWIGTYQFFTQYQFRTWLVEERVITLVFPKQCELLFEGPPPTFRA